MSVIKELIVFINREAVSSFILSVRSVFLSWNLRHWQPGCVVLHIGAFALLENVKSGGEKTNLCLMHDYLKWSFFVFLQGVAKKSRKWKNELLRR